MDRYQARNVPYIFYGVPDLFGIIKTLLRSELRQFHELVFPSTYRSHLQGKQGLFITS